MRDLFVVAAGPKGVEVPFAHGGAPLEPNCLGYAPPYVGTDGVSVNAVSAGTCMVSPSGCTMNFVFTDGTSNYIGTAGHCAGNGKTVIAQVATRVDPTNTIVTLAAIGTVVSSWDQGIGKDFALVRIDPAHAGDLQSDRNGLQGRHRRRPGGRLRQPARDLILQPSVCLRADSLR
jgi:hypothetical protein